MTLFKLILLGLVRVVERWATSQLTLNNFMPSQEVWISDWLRIPYARTTHMFPGRVIYCFWNIPWTPKVTWFKHLEFFLVSHMKGLCMYRLYTLKNIAHWMNWRRQSDKKWMVRWWPIFLQQLENCTKEDGHNLPDLIFNLISIVTNDKHWC